MTPHDHLPPARHRTRPAAKPVLESPPLDPVPTAASSYDVGYGKPPVHSRFKPGRSGNPKGRPKGSKNFDSMVRDILDERITVNTPTGRRKIARIEALLHKMIELAGKGNLRAMDQIIRQYVVAQGAHAPAATSSDDSVQDTTEADAASLAFLRNMLLAGSGPSSGGMA